MKKIIQLEKNDREVLFSRTSEKKGLNLSIVEKDFWVCFMLDHLFHDCKYKDAFVFKGGTSLSKSYHVIERFSEDIDLILDWRKITIGTDPWEERSKTKQDKYNKMINEYATPKML
ncbi:nucleotidyl transferase AbiEii/AbiGii toxin family protein [Eubacterium sp.]|uniref:nucleotidyl transferase AbiEii/AbiGii toxin family protein n=1 Tax=Eubacterium sp. TaxID=142586 RepID=UPI0025CD39F3|nr:nucleotidyl transferase AbiEii/AbiGii toxin family protein [Eubacterium sp.]MCR5629463.1 nucleotidyl transferase AbiEii/AbiGii toxin family protein [Eubacterium sp.]